jgi:hypothetical protein
MAWAHVLTDGVVVHNTFLALTSDFVELPRRARSCPPQLEYGTADRALPQFALEPGLTTVLVRGLPDSSSAKEVFQHLDDLGFVDLYDYAHLPTDTRTRLLRGFGFVNFPDPRDARRCLEVLPGTQVASGGGKPLQACYSDRQGVDANLTTLRGAAKKQRRGAELPWLRVNGDLVPIQDTERRLV